MLSRQCSSSDGGSASSTGGGSGGSSGLSSSTSSGGSSLSSGGSSGSSSTSSGGSSSSSGGSSGSSSGHSSGSSGLLRRLVLGQILGFCGPRMRRVEHRHTAVAQAALGVRRAALLASRGGGLLRRGPGGRDSEGSGVRHFCSAGCSTYSSNTVTCNGANVTVSGFDFSPSTTG